MTNAVSLLSTRAGSLGNAGDTEHALRSTAAAFTLEDFVCLFVLPLLFVLVVGLFVGRGRRCRDCGERLRRWVTHSQRFCDDCGYHRFADDMAECCDCCPDCWECPCGPVLAGGFCDLHRCTCHDEPCDLEGLDEPCDLEGLENE